MKGVETALTDADTLRQVLTHLPHEIQCSVRALCVHMRKSIREGVCVCERERERECVYERERERERECV